MARVKVQEVGKGMHPSEVVVMVRTADGGQEQLIVDERSLQDGTLQVGFPVGSEPGKYLVELPRETERGSWRIWVSPDQIVQEAAA
jgi:hypothetical protein